MNILLDTHIALWAITDSPRLPGKARELIESPRSSVWISAASIWEIAIKHSLGRGDMPVSGNDALHYFRDSGYGFLPIEPEHAAAVGELPQHHADPFDRLLVAQALVEPMRLITSDPALTRYSDTVIHAQAR
jgi:PIN domain nuclease of toxin-antitoxin system